MQRSRDKIYISNIDKFFWFILIFRGKLDWILYFENIKVKEEKEYRESRMKKKFIE